MNEFSKSKKNLKNAPRQWAIFIPVWLVFSLFTMGLSDRFSESHKTFSLILSYSVFIAIPVWLYFFFKMDGFKGPTHLKCQKCGAPAFERKSHLDWKMEGPTRGFHDICPNCGNDNRLDLHDS